jgi:hypothetical protein
MPNTYPAVKEVIPTDDYKLILTFSNGETRLFDMKPYLNKGVFIELLNLSKFRTVHVSFDTVEWDNHADFDPEVLYKLGKKIKGKKYTAFLQKTSAAAESSSKYRKK